jgi:hypothetical protein
MSKLSANKFDVVRLLSSMGLRDSGTVALGGWSCCMGGWAALSGNSTLVDRNS